MPTNYVLSNRQSQPRAIGAGTDHREKYLFQELRLDAWAIVGYVQLQHRLMTLVTNSELAVDPSLNRYFGAICVAQCFTCIAGNIQHRLDQLVLVAFHRGQAWVVVANPGYVWAKFHFKDIDRSVCNFGNDDWFHL